MDRLCLLVLFLILGSTVCLTLDKFPQNERTLKREEYFPTGLTPLKSTRVQRSSDNLLAELLGLCGQLDTILKKMVRKLEEQKQNKTVEEVSNNNTVDRPTTEIILNQTGNETTEETIYTTTSTPLNETKDTTTSDKTTVQYVNETTDKTTDGILDNMTEQVPNKTKDLHIVNVTPGTYEGPSCTAEYTKIPGHTMCLQDSANLIKYGLDNKAVKFILSRHNHYRGNVEPPATDMPKLEWDDNLAKVAQKWANQCLLGHDKVRNIPEYGDVTVGQNVAAGYRGWREVIAGWYNEVELYRYGQNPELYIGPDGWMEIGHYTQVVNNGTFRVGCGVSRCKGTEYRGYFVCNYLSGQSDVMYPYTRGERCSQCPENCHNGVCDCGGKFCRNGGQLHLGSCTCKCTSLYTGETCEQTVCPPFDSPACRSMVPHDCEVYTNVPELCPYFCGLCTDMQRRVFDAISPGSGLKVNGKDFFRSKNNCTFYGVRPSKDECATFGDDGEDKKFACASRGGQFGCDDCLLYSNVPHDYCPVMCGLC